ncbi:MAG TPA: class I SAM-dependent methyltransferase [Gaiellaceae bacterium]
MSEQARSFHRAAAEYDRGRPGWPPGIFDLLPLDDGATVLDLGAGTGKLTRALADRYANVIAVEPLDALRAILEERVPEADVRAGAAEKIPLGDAEVDAVFAGQAFHWFANDTAVAEIARVLRPGGVLALVWNRSGDPSPLPEAYRRRLSELHDARRPERTDEKILERFPFGEEHEATVEHEQVSSRDDVLAFAASVSWIAMRDDRDEVLAELAARLPPGDYVFPMLSEVTWAIRTSD